MKLQLKLKSAVQRVACGLSTADDFLRTLHHAREGGIVSKLLAGASLVSKTIDLIVPHQGPHQLLVSLGWEEANLSIDLFLINILLKSSLTPRRQKLDEHYQLFFYGEKIALVIHKEGDCEGMYFYGDPLEAAKIIQNIVWTGHDLLLSAHISDNKRTQLSLSHLTEPGKYIGAPEPSFIAQRIRKQNGAHSLLIIGPTGSGKSTLARLISRELDCSHRTLKLANAVFSRIDSAGIFQLAKFLAPTTLLIDDMPLNETNVFLELLEGLRTNNQFIVGTLMHDYLPSEDKKGCYYFSGMRPGRVNEIAVLRHPPRNQRRKILEDYLNVALTPQIWKKLLDKTDGLTGAYLQEIAKRFNNYGLDNWELELENVLISAPPPPYKPKKPRRKISRSKKSSTNSSPTPSVP